MVRNSKVMSEETAENEQLQRTCVLAVKVLLENSQWSETFPRFLISSSVLFESFYFIFFFFQSFFFFVFLFSFNLYLKCFFSPGLCLYLINFFFTSLQMICKHITQPVLLVRCAVESHRIVFFVAVGLRSIDVYAEKKQRLMNSGCVHGK